MMFGCNSGVFNNYQYTYSKCLKPPALLVNGRPRFNENEQCLEWLRAWRKTVSNRKDLRHLIETRCSCLRRQCLMFHQQLLGSESSANRHSRTILGAALCPIASTATLWKTCFVSREVLTAKMITQHTHSMMDQRSIVFFWGKQL